MEKQQFKAESQRLLDLMINSIYTHKEIFLREIISNASDAIDKLAYTALTDDKVGINRDEFAITITRDPENRTLTVSNPGTAPLDQEQVFKRFYQGAKKEGSNGLGLALVDSIAKEHGGIVKVLESSETGSTIALMLPMDNS